MLSLVQAGTQSNVCLDYLRMIICKGFDNNPAVTNRTDNLTKGVPEPAEASHGAGSRSSSGARCSSTSILAAHVALGHGEYASDST